MFRPIGVSLVRRRQAGDHVITYNRFLAQTQPVAICLHDDGETFRAGLYRGSGLARDL